LATLRREVAAIDPDLSGFDALPLVDYIDAPLFGQKTAAGLLSVLGALCLVLAAVGLYSLIAYGVSQRTHEIGIRMALGAQSRDVLGMVVRQGLALTSAGLLGGIAVSLAGARLIAGMLLNVSATDPRIFAGAALFLGLVALLASYLPARRAAKVDPMGALRHT
jgi:putative ABC transport system permease protein